MVEVLHAVGAFFLHPLRDMSVDVKRKRCSGVTNVLLNGLEVIAVLQGQQSMGVAQTV